MVAFRNNVFGLINSSEVKIAMSEKKARGYGSELLDLRFFSILKFLNYND